jgi:hypothetical protein
MDSRPNNNASRAELRRIYARMIAAVTSGVILAVAVQVLWPAARGPMAWIALALGTIIWGVVQTAELHLSAGRVVLLFEVGFACFVMTGALIVLLGVIWLLIPWSIGVYAFRKPLEAAFRHRAAAARGGEAPDTAAP